MKDKGIRPCIPGRTSRGKAIRHDQRRCKRRNWIEIMFGRLKDWRRIATRHDRGAKPVLSAVALDATVILRLRRSMSLGSRDTGPSRGVTWATAGYPTRKAACLAAEAQSTQGLHAGRSTRLWPMGEGCPGWSFKGVQPYFLRSEGNTALADRWHVTDGPLGVSNIANPRPKTRAFVMACQQHGIPFNHDFNDPEPTGAGYYQLNVVDGRRCSAARATCIRPGIGPT